LLQSGSDGFELQEGVCLGFPPAFPMPCCSEAVVDDPAKRVPHVPALIVSEEIVGQQHVATLGEYRFGTTEVGRVGEKTRVATLRFRP
jgi:hypothetical protein